MKSARSLITSSVLLLLFAFCTLAQTNKITAREAKDHVGEVQTVCGKVVSTHFATKSKGQFRVSLPAHRRLAMLPE